jgi:hypothetical protein
MNGQLQECVRGAIVTGICAGRTNREIADFNNISVNTVQSFSREYHNFIEEGGQDEDIDINGSSTGTVVMPTAWRSWRRCRRPSTTTRGGP